MEHTPLTPEQRGNLIDQLVAHDLRSMNPADIRGLLIHGWNGYANDDDETLLFEATERRLTTAGV